MFPPAVSTLKSAMKNWPQDGPTGAHPDAASNAATAGCSRNIFCKPMPVVISTFWKPASALLTTNPASINQEIIMALDSHVRKQLATVSTATLRTALYKRGLCNQLIQNDHRLNQI